MQPASIDLRLGDFAWALRCSFLPDVDSTVEEKIDGLAFQRVDLRDGAVLERDRPYLVPLIEELALPEDVRAKANPKSSTGPPRRLHPGDHRPPPPLRRHPRRLPRQALPGDRPALLRDPGEGRALAQPAAALRAATSASPTSEIRDLQDEFPLLYLDSHALRQSELAVADGLFLSLDLSGPDRPRGRLPGEEEQPPGRPLADPRLPLDRLLGPGLPRARRAGRAGAGDLLPAALGRGRLHPAIIEPLIQAIRQTIAGDHDVLMFTSAQQLVNVLQVADQIGLRQEWLDAANRRCVIASIGPTATEAIIAEGLSVDIEPTHPNMGALVKETLSDAISHLAKKR